MHGMWLHAYHFPLRNVYHNSIFNKLSVLTQQLGVMLSTFINRRLKISQVFLLSQTQMFNINFYNNQ